MSEQQKAKLYSVEEIRQILDLSRRELRTLVSEVEPFLAPGDYDGQAWFSSSALRFLRAAQRWRMRGLAWEEVRKRFRQQEAEGLSPIPEDFPWAEEEGAAPLEESTVLTPGPPRETYESTDNEIIKRLDRIYREMKSADQRRREDIQALTMALGRLHKEVELLRYQILSMGSRKDRKRGWWTSQRG